MGLFRKKPSEYELERAVLFAAMLARANERDTEKLTSQSAIHQYLELSFKDLGVKPNQKQKLISAMGVDSLLVENDFINEAVDFRLKNGDAPFPASFREKMLNAMEKAVSDFKKESG